MPATYPRLRADLIVSRQQTPTGLVFVVKDPVVGRFVRFKEPEYFIAQQLDGATALEEIRRRGEERFGAPLAASTLEGFTAKLKNLGLLDGGGAPQPAAAHTCRPGRVRGNIFYLRFKVFDPDRFLTAMVPRLRIVFTRTFAWLSVATILLAAGVTITNWHELHLSLGRLYRVETIPLAWATLLCIVIGHELSHGLTCKRFGGAVHEIGLLL